jgi:sialidase-1
VADESTGTIWLLLTHNLGEDREGQIIAGTSRGTRTVWVTSSEDDGLTWATPREITADVKKPQWTWYATGPGAGIQIKNGPHKGRLVIPCDHISRGGGKGSGNSHVIYSDDHGETWQLGGEPPQAEFNESQIVELADGRLMLNMRNAVSGKRADAPHERGVCISDDGGLTFINLRRDPALVEPIGQASILRYSWPEDPGRGRILFANPASTKDRVSMTIRMSYDEGQTWPVQKLIFEGKSAYSSLVRLPEGAIGLLYEAGDRTPYERIDFARFNLQWLTDGKDH